MAVESPTRAKVRRTNKKAAQRFAERVYKKSLQGRVQVKGTPEGGTAYPGPIGSETGGIDPQKQSRDRAQQLARKNDRRRVNARPRRKPARPGGPAGSGTLKKY